ncbi:TIM barrel protein [Mucilaginibacter gotjawali]|uniref:Inosose dehydratase n=2 Tax=Mucilaginibacter gotjawali TaxID=1550579 RepID=A0A120MZ65_9SPHI|nr:TIM barrel protein [Mucilaginibacter gotjawali]MBB3056430.1 sugar phosphate isomerase/epimerase [Mucilaginibacter gotjawali]BAU55136.1 Inosose dehydratase [Mucilaginibacter gotjawali]
MNNSRRTFLKTSAVAIAGAALLPEFLTAKNNKKIERVGLQLYSVRDAMMKDPAGSLKKLADMGYIHVEHANYVDRKFYGYNAKDFKKLLIDNGLQMPSGHTVMVAEDWDNAKNDFTDKWKYTIQDAAEVGQRYVVSPWLDEKLRTDMDALKRFMDQFNKCGELCKSNGMTFGYHNHNFEFSTKVNGTTLYDYILTNTDPSLVAQQMDVGNMLGAGGIALDLLKKYPGRFELMHVKDEIKSTTGGGMDGYDSTILGTGVMPVKDIVKEARKIGGTSQFIIEQESYQGKDPFDCVKIDLQTMKKWGF